MDPKAEIDKVSKMLKDGGFKFQGVQFEGAVEANDNRVIAVINKMAKTNEAYGVFRVYYEADGQSRVIEIPIGAQPGAPEEPPK